MTSMTPPHIPTFLVIAQCKWFEPGMLATDVKASKLRPETCKAKPQTQGQECKSKFLVGNTTVNAFFHFWVIISIL